MNSGRSHLRTSPVEVYPLFSTPADIFVEVLDYLSSGDVRNLSLVSKTLTNSPLVTNAMYKEPFRSDDFIQHHFIGPTDVSNNPKRKSGALRFRRFLMTLGRNPNRGLYVRKMAMPHFSVPEDFSAIENLCPNLQHLDMGHLADGFPGNRFTWKELVDLCPTFFTRLITLKVDCAALVRNTYQANRNSRNQQQQNRDPECNSLYLLLRACPNLETLVVVGSKDLSLATAECQLHLSDAIAKGAGPRLTTLRLRDMATCFRSFRLFLEPLAHHENFKTIELSFYETLTFFTRQVQVEDYHAVGRDRYVEGKNTEAETLYDVTVKDLQGYLSELKGIVEQGRWNIKSIDKETEVMHNPRTLYPLLNDCGLELLSFMKAYFGWSPVFAWDALVESRSAHLFPSDTLAAKVPDARNQELAIIETLFKALHATQIPVKVELSAVNNRSHIFFDSSPNHENNSNGSSSSEDWFLTPHHLAPLIDELTITYGHQHPVLVRRGRAGHGAITHWHGTLPQVPIALLADDVVGFRPFWRTFPMTFTNLRKLRVCVPDYVHRQWTDRDMRELMPGEGWTERVIPWSGEEGLGVDRITVECCR